MDIMDRFLYIKQSDSDFKKLYNDYKGKNDRDFIIICILLVLCIIFLII